MRIGLWVVAVLWLFGGIRDDVAATTVLQQIHGQFGYLIATVLIVGAEIIGAVYDSREKRFANQAATGEPEKQRVASL